MTTEDDQRAENTSGNRDASTTQTQSPIAMSSQVPAIWQRFFQQMDRIDQLEQQIEEHVSRKRRRIQNLSEQMPSHRHSNVRVFCTHQFEPYSGIWTVVVEGKLLIGNLDHASAAKVDKEGVLSVRDTDQTDEQTKLSQKSKSTAAGDTNSNTPNRNDYKIQAEEEKPVEPVLFTHLFDKVEVSFRTIYQPRTAANQSYDASLFTAKKSRSAKRGKAQQPEPETQVNPADLRSSPPTKLTWNKYANALAASQQKPSSPDANAFRLQYNNHFSERPPPMNMKFHSIVADIRLYPSRPPVKQDDNNANVEQVYQVVNEQLRETFFAGKYGKTEEKKAEASAAVDPATGQPAVPTQPTDSSAYDIPLENEIHVPLFLSYNEIVMALFQYIQDKNLYDPKDRSLVVCDKVLTEILGVESVNFGYMKQLLLEKNLIKCIVTPARNPNNAYQYGISNSQQATEPSNPVCLTYVMNEKSTSLQSPVGFQEEETPGAPPRRTITKSDDHAPSVLSFDLDVAVPSLFNYRARDLMLNVKKREFEYTTCRTKARYMLVAAKGNEDVVKTKIEQAISGQGYEAENIPVFLALARAAHPHSEARLAAQIDAKTCDLMGRVQETSEKASAAWAAVDAMKKLATGNTTESS